MKKLLVTLLALSSISIFGQEALEVGDKAIHTGTFGNVKVKIIAIRADGNYVAKYKSNRRSSRTYGNVPREHLAVMSGCSGDLCVGDKAIHTGTFGNVKVKIIAIRADGNYVAKYRKYRNSRIYGNVRRQELAKI